MKIINILHKTKDRTCDFHDLHLLLLKFVQWFKELTQE